MRVAMTATIRVNWRYMLIGAYWDKKQQALYVCPLPMLVFRFAKDEIELRREQTA